MRPGAPETTAARKVFLAWWIPLLATLLFVGLTLPVLIRGAPLADDFSKCLEPQRDGLGSALGSSFERLGAVRPAHVVEILVTNGVCENLPFGFAIAVPLVLTLAVGVLLRGLLKDLGTPSPWPDIAMVVWLLQPLGTESALWPAALHVPLGLALALIALRLHRAGHHLWGALAVAAAVLSVEQALLALPVAAWLVAGPERRRQALGATLVPIALVLIAFVLWPGEDPRFRASVAERISSLTDDPIFYLRFPAVGLGFQSIPLAVLWAFPMGLLALASGTLLGAWRGRQTPQRTQGATDWAFIQRAAVAALGLLILVNVPVILAIPRQGSPRLFSPTWLVLSALLAVVGSRTSFKRPAVVGAAAGFLTVAAVLSLALSVNVRLRSADFVEAASLRLAEHVQDGDVVALCGVRRQVVDRAPRGAYAVHDLIYEWAARDALEYYTGRRATFVLAGDLWDRPCPDPDTVDRLVPFPQLLRDVG